MVEKRVKLFSNTFMAAGFALGNFALLLLLMWTVTNEYGPEWKKYQRQYYRLLAERVDDPAVRQRILATPLEIKQVWTPKLQIIDRCMTCHLGVSTPSMTDVPQPFRLHPDFEQHTFSEIGCAVCHEGQGFATTVHAAHVMEDLEERFGPFDEQHSGWSRPMLPLEYTQASCQKCHNVMEAPIPGAEHLNKGWQLVQEKGCRTCHYIVDGGAKQAPELSIAGSIFFNESGHSELFHHERFGYLKESLRCPQANLSHAAAEACPAPPPVVTPVNASAKNGDDHAAPPAAAVVAMPDFGFNDEDLRDVVIFLLSLKEASVDWPQKSFAEAAEGNGQAVASNVPAWVGKSGVELVQAVGCMACHNLDGPERTLGPSLWDIGARKDKGYIRESILDPDKVIAAADPPYAPGVMHATLTSAGFYQHITLEALESIVEYLASLSGES